MDTEHIENHDYTKHSSNAGNPSSFTSLSPLHKPKSLSLPIPTLGNSTSHLNDTHNHDQTDESLKDIHPLNDDDDDNNNPIDSLSTTEQGHERKTDEHPPFPTKELGNAFQDESNPIFMNDNIDTHEREGMSAVEMNNNIDKLLGEMYSIQIKNAILMDSIVLMGIDV